MGKEEQREDITYCVEVFDAGFADDGLDFLNVSVVEVERLNLDGVVLRYQL